MKLHLGSDLETPTIAADLSVEEFDTLNHHSDFEQPFVTLLKRKDMLVTPQADQYRLQFMLKKIGRRPKATRPDYLLPVTQMLDRLSCFEEAPDATLTELIVDPYPVPHDGRRGLSLVLQWPQVDQLAVANFASGVMQAIGRQLNYHQSFGGRQNYEGDVGAQLDRYGERGGLSGVIITASGQATVNLETTPEYYEPDEPTFRLSSHNIYSHEHILICLAGAIAISQADELVTA